MSEETRIDVVNPLKESTISEIIMSKDEIVIPDIPVYTDDETKSMAYAKEVYERDLILYPWKVIKKHDTVVLLGTAGTLAVCPWDLPDTDYWACQPVITYKQHEGHRIDALFEMHPMETWKAYSDHLNAYTKDKNIPVFTIAAPKQIKGSVCYPIHDVQEMVKDYPKLKKYFTSTIAYMIALAIWMGYKVIELYGVHMAADEEKYSMQRSCCEAWLSYAAGRGVQYWLPDESSIMHSSYMYGYEQEKGFYLELMGRREQMNNGAKKMLKDLKLHQRDYYMQRGAVLALDQLIVKYRDK